MYHYAMFENADGTTSVARYNSKTERDNAVKNYPIHLGASVGAGQLKACAITTGRYKTESRTAERLVDNYQPV